MQAHTCKGEQGSDQVFYFDGEKIRFGDGTRCLEVASTRTPLSGAALIVRECSTSDMQEFKFDNGSIQVVGSSLCLAVGDDSAEAFGPSHVWRVLSVQSCEETDASLSTWQLNP